jgi:hypothetical protein
MTKRWLPLFILIFAGIAFYLYGKKRPELPQVTTPAPVTQPKLVPAPKLEFQGKQVLGLSPGKETEEIKHLKVANEVSPEWEEKLEETLRHQGGSSVKSVEIQKVDSFIWAQDGIALNVESVIVTLKNSKNQESVFRVLVDAQNGKILKNWDRPVIDPGNPRENFGIKVDPRYHND